MSGKSIGERDALIVVDVQNDFLPGGALGVPQGDAVIPVLNRYLQLFVQRHRPVFATRDWHPKDHCSFQAQGGPWPPHCIARTTGAEFARTLVLPEEAVIISKGQDPQREAYSGFQGTDLAERLHKLHVRRVFVGGLATDYCVRATVEDARKAGFDVVVIRDAVRAVNVEEGDEREALAAMREAGARFTGLGQLDA